MLAASYIEGVQRTTTTTSSGGGVSACIKHFAVNNQESHRMVVNAIVDPRTLRELYLSSFEIAIRSSSSSSQPKFVMGAYNKVNGMYCCNHSERIASGMEFSRYMRFGLGWDQ